MNLNSVFSNVCQIVYKHFNEFYKSISLSFNLLPWTYRYPLNLTFFYFHNWGRGNLVLVSLLHLCLRGFPLCFDSLIFIYIRLGCIFLLPHKIFSLSCSVSSQLVCHLWGYFLHIDLVHSAHKFYWFFYPVNKSLMGFLSVISKTIIEM